MVADGGSATANPLQFENILNFRDVGQTVNKFLDRRQGLVIPFLRAVY
jgi:hypothetical protein